MMKYLSVLVLSYCWVVTVNAFTLTVSSNDFQVSPVFSNVTFFRFTIEIDAPLAAGSFVNPAITQVDYQVTGELVAGTPSGFTAFDLQRMITGSDFYAQGSSLAFEISSTAVLTDGLQVAELVGNTAVFTFDGREVDNGRFHPALLVLNADGSGSIRNSNNIPVVNPLQTVDFGEEYITDLLFDAGNLTLVESDRNPTSNLGGGGGSMSIVSIIALLFITLLASWQRFFSAISRRFLL